MRILQADLLQTKTFSHEDYSDFEIEWITSSKIRKSDCNSNSLILL